MSKDMRWWCTVWLEPWREELERFASGKFHRQEKQGTKELRYAVNLNLGSLTRRELMEERVDLGVAGKGQRTEREQRE